MPRGNISEKQYQDAEQQQLIKSGILRKCHHLHQIPGHITCDNLNRESGLCLISADLHKNCPVDMDKALPLDSFFLFRDRMILGRS